MPMGLALACSAHQDTIDRRKKRRAEAADAPRLAAILARLDLEHLEQLSEAFLFDLNRMTLASLGVGVAKDAVTQQLSRVRELKEVLRLRTNTAVSLTQWLGSFVRTPAEGPPIEELLTTLEIAATVLASRVRLLLATVGAMPMNEYICDHSETEQTKLASANNEQRDPRSALLAQHPSVYLPAPGEGNGGGTI
jgi:hypothetical protein